MKGLRPRKTPLNVCLNKYIIHNTWTNGLSLSLSLYPGAIDQLNWIKLLFGRLNLVQNFARLWSEPGDESPQLSSCEKEIPFHFLVIYLFVQLWESTSRTRSNKLSNNWRERMREREREIGEGECKRQPEEEDDKKEARISVSAFLNNFSSWPNSCAKEKVFSLRSMEEKNPRLLVFCW